MRNLLKGQNIVINAIKDDDITNIEDWFNNVRFLRLYDMLPAIPHTTKAVGSVIEEFTNSPDKLMFAIRLLDSNKIIGIIGYLDIMWTNGTGTFYIGIGEEKYAGKGIGKEAINLMLDYGFYELNLHRIQLNVISYNEIAIKAYERAGFVKEGIYRELLYRDGKRYDLYLYGLLKKEWECNL